MADYDLTDEKQARSYLQNIETEYSYQCLSEKEPDGCHRLADFMDSVKQDSKLGAKLFKMNCDDHKYGHSCFKFAGMRMFGKGVERNTDESVGYFEKACEYNFARGCSTAGSVYLEGKGVDPNIEKGLSYLAKACEKDRGEACAVLGTAYLVPQYDLQKDASQAKLLLGKGCDLGSLRGCVNLSRMYKTGDGIQRNDALAEKYRQAAIKIKGLNEGTTPGISLGRTS